MANLLILFTAFAVVLGAVAVAVRWQDWPDTRGGQGARPSGRSIAIAVAIFAGLVVLVGLAYWIWWALWGNQPSGESATPSDRWFNVMAGLGAVSAVLAFIGSAYLVARYGRRASAAITAETNTVPGSVILSVRPVIRAVGIFRVKFHGPRGAVVRVAELYLAPPEERSGTGMAEGRVWEHPAIFGDQVVEAAEDLTTTAVFRLPPPSPSTVGWTVALGIRAPTRWLPGSTGGWTDRIFVPRPTVKGGSL